MDGLLLQGLLLVVVELIHMGNYNGLAIKALFVTRKIDSLKRQPAFWEELAACSLFFSLLV